MSQTAQGSITGSVANRLQATFVVDGVTRTFDSSLSPAVPPFSVPNPAARINYQNQQDLTGQDTLTGTIGPNSLTLTLGRGPTINGVLQSPIPSQVPVTGSGTWQFTSS